MAADTRSTTKAPEHRDEHEHDEREPKAKGKSTKTTGPVDLGAGISPEGVPYQPGQIADADREEDYEGESPEKLKLIAQRDALDAQIATFD